MCSSNEGLPHWSRFRLSQGRARGATLARAVCGDPADDVTSIVSFADLACCEGPTPLGLPMGLLADPAPEAQAGRHWWSHFDPRLVFVSGPRARGVQPSAVSPLHRQMEHAMAVLRHAPAKNRLDGEVHGNSRLALAG